MESENAVHAEMVATALHKLSELTQRQMECFIQGAGAAQRQGVLSPFPAALYPYQKSNVQA